MERIKKIVDMYRDGERMEYIADEVGCGVQQTRHFVKGLYGLGIITDEDCQERRKSNGNKPTRWTKATEVDKRLADQYLNGKTMKNIAEENATTLYQVQKAISEVYKNRDYPQTLIDEIFGDFQHPATDDRVKALEYCLDTLAERHRDILLRRYRDKHTLNDIAEVYGVTRQRVQQVIAGAIRDIRTGDTIRYLDLGYDEYERHLKELNTEHLSKKLQEINEFELRVPIQGFSKRTFNALMRNNITSLSQITSRQQLFDMRSMGTKCVSEVAHRMRQLGLTLPEK